MKTLPDKSLAWPIPWAAVTVLALAETCRLKAYLCPAGVPTIFWGETVGVRMGMTGTQVEADSRLLAELTHYADEVKSMCALVPTDNELGAMVCLSYNIGLGAFRKSSVLRAHNAGNSAAAARAFALWNKAKVKGVLVGLNGLTSRRAAEAALYLTPEPEAAHEAMPQTVAPESTLAKSPIAQSGAVTAGAGALTLISALNETGTAVGAQVTTASSTIASISGAVGTISQALHVSPSILLAVALAAVGVAVMYFRHKQRSEGWA